MYTVTPYRDAKNAQPTSCVWRCFKFKGEFINMSVTKFASPQKHVFLYSKVLRKTLEGPKIPATLYMLQDLSNMKLGWRLILERYYSGNNVNKVR